MTNDEVTKLNIVARRFGVPFRWLKKQAEAGKFPCIKAENIILVIPANVERFLVESAKGSNSDN